MICPNCGKTYGNKITYCISCGTALENEKEAPEKEMPETEEPPITVTSSQITDEPKTEAVRSISMTTLPENEKSAEKIKSAGASGGVVSALIAILLYAAMLLIFTSCIGRAATDESNILKAVRNMDLLNIPAKELGIDGADISDNSTVSEAIAAMAVGSGVDSGNIRQIYERSTVRDFIGNTIADYAEYIRSGKKPDKITADSIKALFGENISVINTNIGTELSQNDIELAYKQIELSEDILSALDMSKLEEGSIGNIFKAVRAFISVPAIIAELVFAAVAAVFIFVANKNSVRSMRFCGIPVFLAGLTTAMLTFMFSMQLGFFGNMSGLTKEAATGIAASLSENAYQISVIMMILGVCVLIIAHNNARHKPKQN